MYLHYRYLQYKSISSHVSLLYSFFFYLILSSISFILFLSILCSKIFANQLPLDIPEYRPITGNSSPIMHNTQSKIQ